MASSAVRFGVGNVIPETIVDAKGDLIVGTAADTVARLAVGANDKVVKAASGETSGLKYDFPPGHEFVYAQITANVTLSATDEATPTDVVSAGAFTFDGATRVCIRFYSALVETPAAGGAYAVLNLWDDTTNLGRISLTQTPSAATTSHGGMVEVFLTPTSGSHTYKIRGWSTSGAGKVYADVGGAGLQLPAYIRITKA